MSIKIMALYSIMNLLLLNACTSSDSQESETSTVDARQNASILNSVVTEWSDIIAGWYGAHEGEFVMSIDQFNVEGLSTFQLKWIEVSKDFREATMDSLWISEGLFHADIYTYNTVIETYFDSINVSFGLDSEVYLFNENTDSVAVLLHTAGYEKIIDARWMNQDVLSILGYATESVDEIYPIVWIFEMESEQLTRCQYIRPMNHSPSRVNYFRSKLSRSSLK